MEQQEETTFNALRELLRQTLDVIDGLPEGSEHLLELENVANKIGALIKKDVVKIKSNAELVRDYVSLKLDILILDTLEYIERLNVDKAEEDILHAVAKDEIVKSVVAEKLLPQKEYLAAVGKTTKAST